MIMGLEGDQFLWLSVSVLLALVLFLFLNKILHFFVSLGIAAMIPLFTVIFILKVLRGRPSGYLLQWLEAVMLKASGKGLLNLNKK